MASIGSDPNGRKRILFVAGDGSRKTIRLGKATMRQAEAFKVKVEALISAGITGNMDDETSRWLADLSEAMYARLSAVGLARPRKANKTTLQQLLDAFFTHLNVKPITSLGYQPAKAALLEYFGAETPVRDVEPLQAEQWRAKMKADGLAEATVSKRVGIAKHIFQRGVGWKMLIENPFAGVRAGSQINKTRQHFISKEDARKVLDACPDTQWRLLFALSRYGGLRCPSEHLALKWADVDWAHGRLRVSCSKTEHHEGRGERFCPIFPEIRPYLLTAFEEAEPGTEYVITRYRLANCNLRTQLERIIRKAGLSAWPRLFHNLRATRQTELTERFPAHVVAAWIGNTERVAQNHYLQTTDAHFAQACAEPVKDQAPINSAAQNPAQYPAVSGCTDQNADKETNRKGPEIPELTTCYNSLLNQGIAAPGLEPGTLGL
jgi:integrase